MVKISDVAREAGVAASTVSRVMNGYPSVGEEYVTRVREAAERLGYRPNSVARNLRRQATDVIALIVPDVGNFFYTGITRGAEDVARESGLSVLLCNSDEEPEKEARYLDVAESENVAGVLISPHDRHTDISRLRAAGIPVVAIDRHLAGDQDAVTTDSRGGARAAVQHLLEQGWERPGGCAGPEGVETSQWREAGYRDVIEAHGLESRLAYGRYDREGGANATAQLLDGDNPPDSLFVFNEQMALGVVAELRRRNLQPGRDIGLVTFDDTPWAPLIAPPVTVVEQPSYEIGARAVRMLVDRIRGNSSQESRHIILPTRLIARESSMRSTAP